jgi:phosphatidylinositol alpha 1,6-mannosyltransferase
MAAGLPIVASTAGAAPELVRDGRNGLLVPPGDPSALAGAIRRLAGNPRARAEMGRRNRAGAGEHLGWDRVTARHLSLYHGVERRAPARRLLAEQPSSTW